MQRQDIFGALLRFVLRAAGWALVLFVMDMASPYTGVHLALSAVSVGSCALLGVPGLGVVLCASAMF